MGTDGRRTLVERLPYQLFTFFRQHSSNGAPLALITVLSTKGSTYSKAGSQMLVNAQGDFQGMLSGGCLEGDLAERAKAVMTSGVAEVVTYDLRGDDGVFGLGVGCEGALDVLIQALRKESGYEPYASLLTALDNKTDANFQLVSADQNVGNIRLFAPMRLLILGAGQDAEPLLLFTAALGWRVSVSDHRPAVVGRLASSGAESVECVPVKEIAAHFKLSTFDAVIVMSHNLESDRSYLEILATTSIGFIGLLGPPHRKNRLLKEIGDAAKQLGDRLHGPVGKQIGGRGPAAIALEIAAELQAKFSADR